MVATVSEKNNKDCNGRYYYAFLTEKREVGDSSTHTPQHITLFPPFIADQKDVLEIADEVAAEFDPIEVSPGEHAMFGPENNIPVILIKPSRLLSSMHIALSKKLEQKNILIPSNDFIDEDYTPHIALKPYQQKLDENKPINIDHVAVMHKCKNIKTIMAKYTLGKSK